VCGLAEGVLLFAGEGHALSGLDSVERAARVLEHSVAALDDLAHHVALINAVNG